MSEFLINTSIPVTLYSKIVNFRDSNKSFELGGDLLKTMTNYTFNVEHSMSRDRKLIDEFRKEMKVNIKQVRQKSPTDRSLVRLLKSPAIMASGTSTMFLPGNLYQL